MKKNINRVIIISLVLNIVLTLSKLIFGYLGQSHSLVSDGYNSLSDVFVSIFLLIFMKIAHKEPDDNHPYGHEKYEALVYFMLGLALIITGLLIGYNGFIGLISYFKNYLLFEKPSAFTMLIAGFAIIIKLFLFMINKKASLKYDSASLKADSLNHLFDIFSTAASLISIGLSQLGFLYFEYIASILIGIIIMKSSIPIIKEAISFLVDESPDITIIKQIKKTASNVKGVLRIDDIKVRMHMNKYYVDMEIAVNKDLTLEKAHDIAENVHDIVENKFNVLHCMVHVNPSD